MSAYGLAKKRRRGRHSSEGVCGSFQSRGREICCVGSFRVPARTRPFRGEKFVALAKKLFVHECGSENVMKTHLPLCLRGWNADASHTQNLAKLARLRRPRHLTSQVDHIAFNLRRGLRRSYVSPRLCKSASLFVRDALPFNQLMRNFKRNSSCYEQQWRNFDRIELDSRSAKRGDSRRPRIPRRKDENSKRGRCSHADSVETLRMRSICVLNRLLTHTYARSIFFLS